MWVGIPHSTLHFIHNHVNNIYIFRDFENHCWKMKQIPVSTSTSRFVFSEKNSEKLLFDSQRDIGDAVENFVKKHGFMENENFPSYPSITLRCSQNKNWTFQDNVNG